MSRKSLDSKQPVMVPLLDHLCDHFKCSLNELQVHLTNVEMRRRIIRYCRGLKLQTGGLKPSVQNGRRIYCNDISTLNANYLHALNGYLGITVRQYYVVKHQRKLQHAYLPCVIEHGGVMKGHGRRRHQSYYPLEVLTVEIMMMMKKKKGE